MFFRVRAGDGQPGGTGLGSAIAKGIIDAHGETISAEAILNDGCGTHMVMIIPIVASPGVTQ